jgi:hypothetical protein
MYHTSALGVGLPDYWMRMKAGTMPGYFSKIIMIPEIKMGTGFQRWSACIQMGLCFGR